MKKILNLGIGLAFVLFLKSCAVPCPLDIKAAKTEFTKETISWLPDEKDFKTQVFTSNKGRTITFKTEEINFIKRGKLDVEVLCSRGDFLDKTVQVRYIDIPQQGLFYAGSDQTYSLQYRATIANAGGNTGLKDTVLYENFEVWIQNSSTKAASGYLTVFPSLRGNDKSTSVKQEIKDRTDATLLKSVVIGGKELNDVYVNSKLDGLDIYYKRKVGVVAFKDGDEIWLKK
jgi:hypothetical protein